MPVYQYKALDTSGRESSGVLDADSPRDARIKLRTMNLYAVDMTTYSDDKEKTGKQTKLAVKLFTRKRVKADELAMMTRQLATMLRSGIQVMQALTALVEQLENKDLRAVMLAVREKVASGSSLSSALAGYPAYFDGLYTNMVSAGEASGTLDKIMFKLSDYLLANYRIQSKVKAALTYPIFIVIVATCMVAFMLTFVLPQVTEVITSQTNAKLPLPTQILMAVSGFISSFWWLIAIGIAGFVVFIKGLRGTKEGRYLLDSFKLRVPLLGPMFKKAVISRFCMTFATLLESGLPVVESLRTVKNVVNNEVISDVIEGASNKILEGSPIATPFRQNKIFPPVLVYMINIGEESGQLPELLKQIATSYDEEIEIQSHRLTTLLEPLLILVTSVIIGSLVLSVLMPILEMSNIG